MRVEQQHSGEMEFANNPGDADQRPVVNLCKGTEAEEPPYSDPITVAQAMELIGLLDETSIELIRQIVLGNGSISWPQVQSICGISSTDFGHYYYCYGEKIERALQAITQGEQRYLITHDEGTPAWDTDDWKDVKLEIDGPALASLRELFVN